MIARQLYKPFRWSTIAWNRLWLWWTMLYGSSKVRQVTFQQPLCMDEELVDEDDLRMERDALLVRRLTRFSSRSPSPAEKGSHHIGRTSRSDSFGRVPTLENKVQKMEKQLKTLGQGQERHGMVFSELTRKIDDNHATLLKKMGEAITP